MMNEIHLPKLISIHLKNYTLYPSGMDFQYNFIEGINLIIGGNGMGKTTFVNLIKYGIIGHYKKEFDFTRTYKERAINKRLSHPKEYFKSRMDRTISIEDKSTLTIEFEINGTLFQVERFLEEIKLKSVTIYKSKLPPQTIEGEILQQSKYDHISYEMRRTKGKDQQLLIRELENTLQFKYEQEVAKYYGRPFDDLIFFVNNILFFGEDHRTILWDKGDPNTQDELFNKYFNSPGLNEQRQEALRQAKYYNTQARHRSEDSRVIKAVLVKAEEQANLEPQTRGNIIELHNEIDFLNEKLTSLHENRKRLELIISNTENLINIVSQRSEEVATKRRIIEQNLFQNSWIQLHKNYNSYFESIKTNSLCPMCSQELEAQFVHSKIRHPENCILCEQSLPRNEESEDNDKFKELVMQQALVFNELKNLHKELGEQESELKSFDSRFRNISKSKRDLEKKLRNLEFNPTSEPSELSTFYEEIESLNEQKEENLKKSLEYREIASRISRDIEDTISINVVKFSELFSGFAQLFLGMKARLTYEKFDGDSYRFFPVIDDTLRMEEDDLSESQRFFVDHSFRMSILSFFYNNPTFYIVETPDSSLDISYEKNAAEVFIKFLERPFSLIVTTNLNNSEFLSYLIDSNIPISYINLLEIAKSTGIQNKSEYLKSISDNIFNKMKSKR